MSETSLISFSEYNLSNSDLLAAQQDSLRSLLSTQTGFTIENMQDNSEIASNLDLSTDLDSTESTPHKILFNSMDDDAEDSYSRKRRASDRDDLPSDRDASSNGSSVLAMIEEVINFLPNTEAKLMSGFNTSPIIENNNQIYFEDIRSDFIPQNFSHHHQQQQLHCELNNIQQQHLPAQYLILQRLDSFDSVQVHLNDDDNENDSVMDEENEGEQHIPRPEDPEPKLGIYNEVTRAIRLEKYREKRQKLRCDEVKYTRRQQVSINRPRSKGRFVKRQSVSETSSEVPIKLPAERKVEFEEIPGETSSKRKERRSAWEMLKNLFLQPSSPRNEKRVDKRFSLPPTPTFSEKLFLKRRKSTTAASTVSGRAKRKNSVDEFLAEEALEEPIRKRRWS